MNATEVSTFVQIGQLLINIDMLSSEERIELTHATSELLYFDETRLYANLVIFQEVDLHVM